MKALVKKEPRRGLWLEETKVPEIGDDDVLIRVHGTSICGTDVHIYEWDDWAARTIPVPMAVGHEFWGVVEKVGPSARGLSPGDRVSGEGHIVCGHCRNCRAGTRHLCINTKGLGVHRPGCFAELLSLPASNVFPLPKGVSDGVASVLDPLGNAVHSALSFDLVGEDVLVTGAGPIGIMAALISKHVGARNVVVTDLSDERLALARQLGVDHAVNVRQQPLRDVMASLGMKEGFDVGLEMSGAGPALRDIVETAKPGAKISLLGLIPDDSPIQWNQVIFKGLFLKGIYGREMFETWYKMCALLEGGLDVSGVITHRFPFSRFEEAFAVASSGRAGKVVLEWH